MTEPATHPGDDRRRPSDRPRRTEEHAAGLRRSELVGEAGDGNEALAHCRQNQPDVILMDMAMPGMDGIAATRAVLEHYPQMKIVMLTSFVEDRVVQNALEAGAVGYLLKNVPINTLAEAIRSAYAGQPSLSPEATTALIRTKTGPREPGQDLSDENARS